MTAATARKRERPRVADHVDDKKPRAPASSDAIRDDPVAIEEARKAYARTEANYCDDLKTALTGVDAVVVVMPWPEYRDVPELLKGRDPQPLFVDGRRAFDANYFDRYDGIRL